jgi:hypothetical protein
MSGPLIRGNRFFEIGGLFIRQESDAAQLGEVCLAVNQTGDLVA